MSATAPASFVLLHGAGLGGWCWQHVTPLLRLPALAVDLPGRGATPGDLRTATRATYVRAVVETIAGAGLQRCVLVAHSFTGGIAHLVAAALPRQVAQIIFLAATVPPPGHAVIDLFPAATRAPLRLGLALAAAGAPIPRWVWWASLRSAFTELDAATLRAARERLVMPEAAGMFLFRKPLPEGSIEDAARVAGQADFAVVCVGTNGEWTAITCRPLASLARLLPKLSGLTPP